MVLDIRASLYYTLCFKNNFCDLDNKFYCNNSSKMLIISGLSQHI